MDMHVERLEPQIAGLATAVPPHQLPQDLVATYARRILGPRYRDFERLAKTFETSGVETRHSVCPIEWFEEPQDWPARARAYQEGATALFVAAARAALDDAQLKAEQIDTIVTVSSTGISTPTLEVRAMAELDFRPNVRRVPVFGLGCAGGVTGLALAARLAAANPGSNVLFVCVETCTLAFRADRLQNADIIATVLFGDGAAATCLSTSGDTGRFVGAGQEHTWRDTLSVMGWEIDGMGLGVIFDRSIPAFVNAHFKAAVMEGLDALELDPAGLARYVCHPGGMKVVEAIEDTMELQRGTLGHEREVLRDHGNMSAPTVLFVLERLAAQDPKGQMLLTALGPGFTASMVPVRFE